MSDVRRSSELSTSCKLKEDRQHWVPYSVANEDKETSPLLCSVSDIALQHAALIPSVYKDTGGSSRNTFFGGRGGPIFNFFSAHKQLNPQNIGGPAWLTLGGFPAPPPTRTTPASIHPPNTSSQLNFCTFLQSNIFRFCFILAACYTVIKLYYFMVHQENIDNLIIKIIIGKNYHVVEWRDADHANV